MQFWGDCMEKYKSLADVLLDISKVPITSESYTEKIEQALVKAFVYQGFRLSINSPMLSNTLRINSTMASIILKKQISFLSILQKKTFPFQRMPFCFMSVSDQLLI